MDEDNFEVGDLMAWNVAKKKRGKNLEPRRNSSQSGSRRRRRPRVTTTSAPTTTSTITNATAMNSSTTENATNEAKQQDRSIDIKVSRRASW